jgi:phenylalanyl-tRNA synthetase beta chain
MIADAGVTHARILEVIRAAAPPELTEVRLFDIFRAAEEGSGGRRSLAYSLVYRSPDRSLTDEEANRLHDAVKSALRKELNAEIREG